MDPISILSKTTINVHGKKASGVVFNKTDKASGNDLKSSDDRKDSGTKLKHGQENTAKASSTTSFDYTEYVDPKNIAIRQDEEGEVDDVKNPPYQFYKVSGKGIKKRGLAVIINVRSNGKDERLGSEKDVEKMKSLWSKMGFDVKVETSPTKTHKEAIETILKEAAGLYGGIGAIVIIIMSHGTTMKNGEEVFATSDGKIIKFNDVISLFDNKNAKSLRGIPKLFFCQYCRGTLKDFVEDDDIAVEELSTLTLEGGAEDDDGAVDHLPARSDMMVAFATRPGYKALRNESKGSYFFTVIANVFSQHAREEHVLELMTRVNLAMATKTYVDPNREKRKQMNEVRFDLTKRLYLLK